MVTQQFFLIEQSKVEHFFFFSGSPSGDWVSGRQAEAHRYDGLHLIHGSQYLLCVERQAERVRKQEMHGYNTILTGADL